LLAADGIFIPDAKTSTAGTHVAKILQQLGIAHDVTDRLKIFPNGATAMRGLAESDALRPIGCTQSTEIISTPGLVLSGPLPPGYALSTIYTAAVTRQGANARQAQGLIDLLIGPDQREAREHCRLPGQPKIAAVNGGDLYWTMHQASRAYRRVWMPAALQSRRLLQLALTVRISMAAFAGCAGTASSR
jgi:hypothetical protein